MNQFKFRENNSTGGGRLLFKAVKLIGQSLLLLMLACQTTQLSAQLDNWKAGSDKSVEIPKAGISILFRYCPKTTEPVVTGDPRVSDSPRFTTNGFWLSEMEITQAEYAAVMGATELTKLKGRLGRAKEGYKRNVGGKYFSGDELPVYLLTMREAVAFCEKLEEMKQAAEGGVIRSTFRIPSQYEWQYACRGRVGPEAADFPHFSGWPPTIPEMEIPKSWDGGAVNLKTFCESIIKEKNLSGNGFKIVKETDKKDRVEGFTGTQAQVMAICDADEGAGRKILGVLLKHGHVLEYDLYHGQGESEIEIELGKASGGEPNGWNLRHMQTNVYEWGVFSESPDLVEIKRSWANLKQEDEGTKGAILGAGFMVSEWERYRIWHQAEVEYGDLFPLPEDVDDTGSKLKAGIRLLHESGLARDWLVMIRKAAITNPIPELDHEQLSRHRRNVPRRLPDTEADVARGRIDYYRALAYMRAKDTDNAMKAFKQAEPVIVKNDDYFKFLSVVLSEDGK